MSIKITAYEALCNLGLNIDEIYTRAIYGDNTHFTNDTTLIPNLPLRLGKIDLEPDLIGSINYNTRCNRLIKHVLSLIKPQTEELFSKYPKDEIAVIIATTNSGVEEFETSKLLVHSELGSPAMFTKDLLGLKNSAITVSTACSSGTKAFSAARNYLNTGLAKAVLVIGVDTIARLPLYGFSSLEILSQEPTNPFSKNYTGINIGEACTCFIVEGVNDGVGVNEGVENNGIEILGIAENSDTFHSTTPDPEAKAVKNALKDALNDAKVSPEEVDYINLHGTGTLANDKMEAEAINSVFGENIPVSSTKPLTGHCLGAAACIETALCCHLLNKFSGKMFPHVYDNEYNPEIKPVNLVNKSENYNKCKICISNSFGFGGTNAIIVLGKG